MQKELKPCPFCGEGKNIRVIIDGLLFGENIYVCKCMKCGARAPVSYNSGKQAIERWNRRAEVKDNGNVEAVPVLR